MKNQTLEIKAAIQISKPADEVFEAIIDPVKMSNYFISKSSGRMEEGKKIIWNFPEFKMDAPIRVGKIEKNKYISFFWFVDGLELLTESLRKAGKMMKPASGGLWEIQKDGLTFLPVLKPTLSMALI